MITNPRLRYLIPVLILLAAPIHAEPVESILLVESTSYAKVERTDYRDPAGASRTYIRTFKAGRFLERTETERLVDSIYFYHVKQASPFDAARDSLLFFDAGAEYVWYGWNSNLAARQNFSTRTWKISLLALTAIAWRNADRQAAALAGNSYMPPPHAAVQRFQNSRNLYYAIGAATIGYFSWTTYRAYTGFGHDSQGRDLEIPARTETDPDAIPGLSTTPGPFSFAPRDPFAFSVSIPVAFSGQE